jgi:hypothetical protein
MEPWIVQNLEARSVGREAARQVKAQGGRMIKTACVKPNPIGSTPCKIERCRHHSAAKSATDRDRVEAEEGDLYVGATSPREFNHA